jgi:hypothetical protein
VHTPLNKLCARMIASRLSPFSFRQSLGQFPNSGKEFDLPPTQMQNNAERLRVCAAVEEKPAASGGNNGLKQTKEKTMKTIKYLLTVTAGAVLLNLAGSAQAGEPLYAPKAKALADSLREIPGVSSDVDLTKNRPAGNAKAWELARSLRKFPGGPNFDLAHGPRPAFSPKDPRYEAEFRRLQLRQFSGAAMK